MGLSRYLSKLAGLVGSDGKVPAAALGSDILAGICDKANTSTGYLDLPAGTTAQRPGSPNSGMSRFNTDTGTVEVFGTSGWMQLASGNDPYWADVALYLRGGSLTDLKGRHTVTSVGSSTQTSPGKPFAASPSTSWYRLCSSGSADVYLDVASYLDDFDPGQNTNWTVEFWLYKEAGYTSYGHFFNIGGQGGQGVIKFAGDDSYGLYWYTTNGETIGFGGGGSFTAATWTHFAFEKQGTQLTTWKNGVRMSQTTNAYPAGSPAHMRLGFRYTTEYCPHYFDELRVTRAARYGGTPTIPVQTAPYPMG